MDASIEIIGKDLAKVVIEKNHYSHKIPQAIKFRFGMYLDGTLRGVAIFSIPSNMHAITSVFRNENQSIVIELSRFFTEDNTPRNFESKCLSMMLAYLRENTDYDVVLSYADPNYKHIGYLYQATNFKYIGESSKEVRYLLPSGELITRRGLGRSSGDTEREHSKRLIECGARKIKMDGKHKYIYFICNRRRKGELMSKMKCELLAYPKIKPEVGYDNREND
jgi:hypothetical protein